MPYLSESILSLEILGLYCRGEFLAEFRLELLGIMLRLEFVTPNNISSPKVQNYATRSRTPQSS
jgi:hypothetical protein